MILLIEGACPKGTVLSQLEHIVKLALHGTVY